jgi:multiple sugar transport system substrate-binding protein
MQSKFYNFPAWTNAINGGFKRIHQLAAQDKHRPLGKYTVLTTIAEKFTTNVGHPGFANAAIDEAFQTFLIPQMFANVAQGKQSAEDAARDTQAQYQLIYTKWKGQGLQ